MRSSPSDLEVAARADQVAVVRPCAWLQKGELLVLEAVCAVGRRIHLVVRRVLEAVGPSSSCVAKTLVLIKCQFLLLKLGDFLLRLGERRLFLAQRVFQSEHLLLHREELPDEDARG